MNVNEMSASQIIEQLNMMFDWKRRPHEGKFLQRAIELLKEQPDVVRCNDCKWRGTYQCPIYVGGDGMCGSPDEWYCAGGERK